MELIEGYSKGARKSSKALKIKASPLGAAAAAPRKSIVMMSHGTGRRVVAARPTARGREPKSDRVAAGAAVLRRRRAARRVRDAQVLHRVLEGPVVPEAVAREADERLGRAAAMLRAQRAVLLLERGLSLLFVVCFLGFG